MSRRRALLLAAPLLPLLALTACSSGDPGVGAGGPPATAPGSLVATTASAATLPAATVPAATAPATVAPTSVAPPPTSTTAVPTTVRPAASAPRPVRTLTLPLVDPSRPTVSRGTTVAPTRTLTTTVYVPEGSGGPWPLVVFGHGFRLGPSHYDRIARVLAGAGYVVAAPSFPLADEAVAGAAVDRGDLPNQAADVSFVLDQLLGPAGPPGLAGVIDPGRVGMVGHSDGADVALDVGYVTGRADPRVRAVVALSPDAIGPPGAGTGRGTPLLVVHGDRDTIAPFSEGQTVFSQVGAHRLLVRLLGGGHLEPVQGAAPWSAVLDATTVAFLDAYVAGRSAGDGAVVGAGDVAGVASIQVAG